jgi:hypothetical protein
MLSIYVFIQIGMEEIRTFTPLGNLIKKLKMTEERTTRVCVVLARFNTFRQEKRVFYSCRLSEMIPFLTPTILI